MNEMSFSFWFSLAFPVIFLKVIRLLITHRVPW